MKGLPQTDKNTHFLLQAPQQTGDPSACTTFCKWASWMTPGMLPSLWIWLMIYASSKRWFGSRYWSFIIGIRMLPTWTGVVLFSKMCVHQPEESWAFKIVYPRQLTEGKPRMVRIISKTHCFEATLHFIDGSSIKGCGEVRCFTKACKSHTSLATDKSNLGLLLMPSVPPMRRITPYLSA